MEERSSMKVSPPMLVHRRALAALLKDQMAYLVLKQRFRCLSSALDANQIKPLPDLL